MCKTFETLDTVAETHVNTCTRYLLAVAGLRLRVKDGVADFRKDWIDHCCNLMITDGTGSTCTANILCGTQLHHISWKSWKLKYKLDWFMTSKSIIKIAFILSSTSPSQRGRFIYSEMQTLLSKTSATLRQVVSHGSGLSKKVSLYLKEVTVEKSALEE